MSQADLCLVDSVANAPPPFPGITTTAAVHDSSSPAPTQMDHGKLANETSPINQPLVCFPSFLQNFDHFFLLQTTISMGTLKVCFAHSSLECDVVSNISWLEFCYQYLEFFWVKEQNGLKIYERLDSEPSLHLYACSVSACGTTSRQVCHLDAFPRVYWPGLLRQRSNMVLAQLGAKNLIFTSN